MVDFSNSNVDSVILGKDSQIEHEDDDQDMQFVVVGHQCQQNQQLQEALRLFNMSVVYSTDGLDLLQEAGDYNTIFILADFSGESFHRLHRAGARIVGPPVIIKCAFNDERLPCNTRPLYCTLMRHLILCFTGIRVREELSTLADLVHHMGGSIRKDFTHRVTHLVANCTAGEKYRAAVSFGTTIMTEEWVHQSWQLRNNHMASATDEELMCHKMKLFAFSTISFYGFSREEEHHMVELTDSNGGTYAEAGAPTSTHLVVDEHSIKTIPFEIHQKLHVVKTEWFWASIQMDACADEQMYKFEEIVDTPNSKSTKETPKTMSGSKSRKRKRLRENLAQLAADTDQDSPMCTNKRRSKELARMSLSASYLEVTDLSLKSPESTPCPDVPVTPPSTVPLNKMSARQLTVMELLQTEKNYVGILHTILQVFKQEIERPDQRGGPLLSATDIKLIFGGITPIYDVHVKIRDQLQSIINNWHNDQSIGNIFVNLADSLLKAYPPFVNFFENTKETISNCDKVNPRFHAFLKLCQTKPECGRQTLTELLIRPVQRLPSIMLLLKEIQKRTEKSQGDYTCLEDAIHKLEEVMTHINEDKRRAEGHQLMFDIINDIDNCPPNLLSSHRSFIMKVDVIEVTDTLSGKGDNISLFLFSDSLEMCKRRVKVLNAKSPAPHAPKTPQKAYKHLDMIQLSNIKKVVNIDKTKDCKNVFALVQKEVSKREKLYAFLIVEEDLDKTEFLQTLSKHICNTTCRADYENLLISTEAHALNLDVDDLHTKTLSKAATKFGKRVSRAFSFNKTPREQLKRAMSTMMSPTRHDSMTFVNPNHTPGSNLRGMRLASTNDLTPLQDESFYSNLMEHHNSFLTPRRRRETLAVIVSPQAGTLPHAASCADLDTQMKKIKLARRKSVMWRVPYIYQAGFSSFPSLLHDATSPLFATPSRPNPKFKASTIGHAAVKHL